jgi:sec-independent protein translocase protein TatA
LVKQVGYRVQQDAVYHVAGGGVDVFGLGLQELIIIMVIALVIFGGKKLPEVGSGLGKAIREFKRGTSEPDEIDVTPKATSEAKEPAASAEQDRASQDRTRTS